MTFKCNEFFCLINIKKSETSEMKQKIHSIIGMVKQEDNENKRQNRKEEALSGVRRDALYSLWSERTFDDQRQQLYREEAFGRKAQDGNRLKAGS